MRELKFRAWLDEHKQYIYFGGEYKEPTGRRGKGRCSLVGNNHIADLAINEDDSNKFFIVHKVECIEQYTGLKDKNGKEIYEGDILQDESNDAAVVIWREHHAEWGIKWIHMGIEDSLSHRMEWGHLNEIIGNIHENPELLEEK